jgi:hypothetical protein
LDGYRLWRWQPVLALLFFIVGVSLYFALLNRFIDYSLTSTIGFVSLAAFVGIIAMFLSPGFQKNVVEEQKEIVELIEHTSLIDKEADWDSVSTESSLFEDGGAGQLHESIPLTSPAQTEVQEMQTQVDMMVDIVSVERLAREELQRTVELMQSDQMKAEDKERLDDSALDELAQDLHDEAEVPTSTAPDPPAKKSLEDAKAIFAPELPSASALMRKKKRELIDLCKERSLDYSGTKKDMVARLTGATEE